MTQQVINIGEVANDGTGEALRNAFQAVNDNFTEVYTAGPVGSNIQIANNTITTTVVNQNIVLRPNGIGNIQANAAILPGIDGVYDLGRPNQRFDSIYGVYFYGNGAGLTGVTTSGIANGTTSISTVANGNITFNISGTPNVAVFSNTVAEFDTDITASGNVTGNYILGNGALLTGVITSVANINSGNSNVSINTPGGNVVVSVRGVANVATFTANSLQVSGNVVADNFIGNITGNLTVAGTNTGVLFNDSGVANAVPGLTFTKATGNLTASGNISGDYLVGNGVAILGVLADRGTDTNNWDTLIKMGVYTVNRTSWSGVTGAPLDSQIFVGLLEIKNSTSTAIEQIFYPGQTTSDVKMQWNRANWGGTWTSWVKMVNDGQIVTGGEF